VPPEEVLTERIPPQSIEAEAATLGAMLLEGEAAGLAAESLTPDDFYRSGHRTIFEAICEIYDSGQQPDELVLRERLKEKGRLDEIGGGDYLHALATSVPSAANLEHYARIVREKAVSRRLIEACTASLRDAEGGGEIGEVLDRAEQRIYEVASRRGASDVLEIRHILDHEFENLMRRHETPGLITGIPTGINRLNQLTGGFQRSDFIILAARPSVGKTALALNIVEHVARKEGLPALLFSLEMAKQQVALRMLCTHCEVDYQKLRSGYISSEEWQKIVNKGMGDLREAPVYIDDTPAIGAMELRAKARRMKSRHDIQLVVVDYLQLMGGPREQSREREVAKISAALKALARELNIPVLALSQIRRAAEERAGGRPQLADLRESGALEQDADVVMILHRDRDPDGRWLSEASLNIAKQRNGPTGVVDLYYEPKLMRFGQVDVFARETGPTV
jgi:replicative DNA helicase